MTPCISMQTARLLRAVCFLGVSLTTVVVTALPAVAQTLPAQGAPAPTAITASEQQLKKPFWTDLTPTQQQALAPLAQEWDKLDTFRKNKWLAIGNRFSSMKPDEQQRVQERMREWVALTPEQRRVARENYVRARKLKPDQKSAQWEEYQQLPEEQKRKLAADAASRKQVTTLPPPAQHKNSKTLPPIKAAPKPMLEQSVTPQAASQSTLQPSPPANK